MTAETKDEAQAKEESGVATKKQNAKLEHSDESGGVTTRDDATDMGVPMLPGSPDEPTGPEDALGEGPKRGDYRNRLGNTQHHQVVPTDNAGELDKDGNPLPTSKVVPQNPRAEDIGDEEGKKGGVETG